MTIEERIRETVDGYIAKMRLELDAHAQNLAADLTRLVAAEQDVWREDRDRRLAEAHADAARMVAHGQDVSYLVAGAGQGSRESRMETLERLMNVMRRIDEATSLTGILGALMKGAAAGTSRVAILLVDGYMLRTWEHAGFEEGKGPTELPVGAAGPLAAAVALKQTSFVPTVIEGRESAVPGFMRVPAGHTGLIVPLSVGGDVVAVLYADDVARAVEQEEAPLWTEEIQILARHAALRLENVTSVRTVEGLSGYQLMPQIFVLVLVALLFPATLGPGRSEAHVPQEPGALWLVPASIESRPNALANALDQLQDGNAEGALPVLRKFTGNAVIAPYVRLHQGRAELALGDNDAAAASAAAVLKTGPKGYLREQALWLSADAAEARSNWKDAAKALSDLTDEKLVPADLARAHYRLGVAAHQSDRRDDAVEALTKVHDVFPTSTLAASAKAALLQLDPAFQPVTKGRVPVALVRAQLMFDALQFKEARAVYVDLLPLVGPQDRDVVTLRLAQCDARLKQFPGAHLALQAYVNGGGTRLDEAEYTRLGVLRDLGRTDEYIRGVRAFVDRQPDPAFAHAALNDLGTHHILADNDDKAAAVFTESYDRFPNGAFAARAAWKAGWHAFMKDNYAETIRLFESAALGLRRSDYRSGWVYWAARAHERMGHRDQATAGYLQTIADYRHSYYGREAERILEDTRAASRPKGAGPVVPIRRTAPLVFDQGAPPSNAALVQALLSAQLFADAVGELRRVQRVEANSAMIEATLAYAYNRKGDLRFGISAMKRAYPQYMADGGDALPRELRTVLFPVAHWDLLQKYAALHKLDPFLIAALVAQESTFDAVVRSSANAWGLMQILPSTGRQYARLLKIPRFTTESLTNPEINVKIGTAYFADKIKEFGGVAPALASYNAGESRVHQWLAERPGVDRDEFIDGIPFPETQGYVKKIIGTAEDYRLLYRATVAK